MYASCLHQVPNSTTVNVSIPSPIVPTLLGTSRQNRSVASPGKNQLPLMCRMPGCFQSPETELHIGQLLPGHTITTSSPDSKKSSVARNFVTGASSTLTTQGCDDPAPIGLGRDDLLQVISVSCAADKPRQQIRWTGAPHQFHVYPPYIIGVSSLIRSISQFILVRYIVCLITNFAISFLALLRENHNAICRNK